jgi:hypothetical protein
MRTFMVAASVGAFALGFCAGARASEPVDVQVGTRFGAGTNPVGGGLPNPMGFGAGGRAGLSFYGVYAGATAIYYAGRSGTIDIGETEFVRGTITPHSFLYGLELGYGVKIARVLELRAGVGVGDDVLGAAGMVGYGCTCDNVVTPPRSVRSVHYVYWEPTFTALVDFGRVYVGADVSVLLLPSGPVPIAAGTGPYSVLTLPFSDAVKLDGAATVHAQVGMHF